MSTSTLIILIIAAYSFASVVYIYKYRGVARSKNLRQYLRKSWPIFAPLNCMLYLNTKPKAAMPIQNLEDFPELAPIRENWQQIRDEAVAMVEQGYFDQTKEEGSAASYDVGFRTFFKYGWSKFYVKWYGYTHDSAKQLCPKTVEILKDIPCVNGAMFTLLPAGSKLTKHADPIACSLRYHLGLATPNHDDCFINIDKQKYSWRDGDALLFDETYLHFAKNKTEYDRLILMCDVERPTNIIGRFVNSIYKILASMTLVPNTSIDKRGFFNKLFHLITPIMNWGQELRKTNKKLYKALEYTLNTTLLIAFLYIFYIPFKIFG
jgi:beta-hydroxylase